jgi:hypothetical protein
MCADVCRGIESCVLDFLIRERVRGRVCVPIGCAGIHPRRGAAHART